MSGRKHNAGDSDTIDELSQSRQHECVAWKDSSIISLPTCFGSSMLVRRHSRLSLLVICCVFLGVRCSSARAEAKPNVVIVITDDQGYGDLSCHGNPILKTPNLDALHADAVRLVDYHVAPTCSPTRAAFLTGHWTNRTGVWHTIMGRSMLRENEITMGQVFKDSGYATGMFGK